MSVHFGTLLRLLRVDSGISLRQLAGALEVSPAYLSRVENGHDAAPTPDRLAAIARTLGVPPSLLLELTDNAGSAVAQYVRRVPSAAAFFLEVAERDLGPAEIARLAAHLEDGFPRAEGAHRRVAPRVSELLDVERVVMRLVASDWDDVLDIAAARLGPACGLPVRRVREALAASERQAPSAVGRGLALPHALVAGARPAAALLVLARPLAAETPDGRPLGLAVALVLPAAAPELLARAARLATLDAPTELAGLGDAHACLSRLAQLERG